MSIIAELQVTQYKECIYFLSAVIRKDQLNFEKVQKDMLKQWERKAHIEQESDNRSDLKQSRPGDIMKKKYQRDRRT